MPLNTLKPQVIMFFKIDIASIYKIDGYNILIIDQERFIDAQRIFITH